MAKRIRARGEDVRKYILEHLEKHPHDLSKFVADHFGITRQAVSKHLKRLSSEHAIVESGQTRNRTYKLATLAEWDRAYAIAPNLAEDLVWRDDVSKVIGDMPENVLAIWHYGFTEMFNNALDHAAGTTIYLSIKRNAVDTEMIVKDNGVGIFKKIQTELGLLDERHAILELAKGKLTTDPKRHPGEGIFFSSRMFDQFDILSGAVFFTHKFEDTADWILERDRLGNGTFVWMKLNNHTSRTTTKIFNQYTSGDDYGFTMTVVPVNLARYGNENLISRSQAKRLLARIELFKKVLFDFSDVPTIGQAFADEIFRVFALGHPNIELVPIHANSEVKRMIDRARFAGSQGAEKTS
jgi:anti-sigma regulatory factor (Ser/Thr protein kinase)/DNA-binding transcriptional ArsR family regulator